ncbi:hypothetical protein NW768_002513 [Fusarium equiseti]|uniref:Aminoglycoside phosphotransferase domain-containing protein n=1 Tax=Fusarium equiseti TaxID=61235 RepID=A0ABQ8RNX5_FUSEQ|nr:hypothetical protein NW768_002513 [Fusarium equiseti]
MEDPSRPGLLWDTSDLDLKPIWVNDPSIKHIVKCLRSLFRMEIEEKLCVSFLGEGAINKAYLVITSNKQFVLRVSLPIDPSYKTRGEVATLNFLNKYTGINVPTVDKYSDSSNNPFGFEWILETRIPGDSAFNKWREMSMSKKKDLVLDIVTCQQQIMQRSFNTIGTLNEVDGTFAPGRLASMDFCFGDRFFHKVSRGPFHCTHNWFHVLTQMIILDYKKVIDDPGDDDDVEDATFYHKVTQRLQKLIPALFPITPEQTVLWHDDLSFHNIMLSEKDSLSGIIDWEFVSVMPLWVTTQPPAFLAGPNCKKKPDPEDYDFAEVPSKDMYGRNNHGKSSLYWDDLLDYEQTVLRDLFNEAMSESVPGWQVCLENSTLEVDFLKAITLCRNGSWGGPVDDWIDELEEGNVIRLRYGRRSA